MLLFEEKVSAPSFFLLLVEFFLLVIAVTILLQSMVLLFQLERLELGQSVGG